MKTSVYSSLLAAPFALAGVVHPRDPGWQHIPDHAKAPNTFNVGTKMELGQPPQTSKQFPDVFMPRKIDIPFGRLVYGKVMYFKPGEMNTEDGVFDTGVGINDDAKQSACGIPDNAYWNSKVAIHPYWLKYAGLDRYCMQDVCVSFWTGHGDDMISKVTDICSTDPEDPSHCASPEDIKLPRTKVQVLRHKQKQNWSDQPELSGNEDTQGVYWYFSKCLGEAIVQDAYKVPGTDNWFSTPEYPENNKLAVQLTIQQYNKNQWSYPAKGWDTYPCGVTPGRVVSRFEAKLSNITDWVPGQEPEWQPIAGGEGYGKPRGKRPHSTSASPFGGSKHKPTHASTPASVSSTSSSKSSRTTRKNGSASTPASVSPTPSSISIRTAGKSGSATKPASVSPTPSSTPSRTAGNSGSATTPASVSPARSSTSYGTAGNRSSATTPVLVSPTPSSTSYGAVGKDGSDVCYV